jgi:hypothetical protein
LLAELRPTALIEKRATAADSASPAANRRGRLRAAFFLLRRSIASVWSTRQAHGASLILLNYFQCISQLYEKAQFPDRETARKTSAKPLSHKQKLLD